jgi:hypothetical protein
LIVLLASSAHACSVPVFRYGLNYWPADGYELQAAKAAVPDDANVNLTIKPSTDGAATLRLGDREVWLGQLAPDTLGRILDSPIRRQIATRILNGDSVVWVLVESGNAAADDAAFKLLTDRLKYLESIAIVPDLRPDDPLNRIGPGPALAIRHSVVRLSRTDAKESFTLAMLEREPTDGKTPTAYPIFGRGRVLIALPQEKLTTDNIDEVSQFLTAQCSCEVKDNHMGWDLLMNCDWDQELAKAEQKRLNGPDETAATQPVVEPVAPPQALAPPQTLVIHSQSSYATADSLPTPRLLPTRYQTIAGSLIIVFLICAFCLLRFFGKRA